MRRAGALAAAASLVGLLLFAATPEITGRELVMGLAAALAGALAVLGLGPSGLLTREPSGRGEGTAFRTGAHEPAAVPDAVESLLRAVTFDLDASRIAVWHMDRRAGTLLPVQTLGGELPAQRAGGSPLAWALEEGGAVRLEPAPPWATGSVVAAGIDERRVLTVERDAGKSPPNRERVVRTAGLMAAFFTLYDRQQAAIAATDRVDRIAELLRTVPRRDETAGGPTGLAKAALELLDGDGALVASWDGTAGQVLARAGTEDGPERGMAFEVTDGDLAHAARTAAVIRRAPDSARRPPLASKRERWRRRPPHRVAIPLVHPDGGTRGVLAAWGSSAAPEQAVTLLDAIGPLLAFQLAQASDLVRFREQATVDPLTGLPNRAALDERMAEARARFDRYRRPVAVLVVDLDRFKRVNDRYGHDAGDAVLRQVARVLRAVVRDVDFTARFGGEELVVVLPETMLTPALDVAERIRAAVEAAPIEHDGQTVPVTASIGVSACPECVDTPADLFASADRALYASKTGGRNRVTAAPIRAAREGVGG